MRINVEDSIDSDFRFKLFEGLLGCKYKALGAVVIAWRLAQRYWCREKSLIPKKEWELFPFFKEMEKSNLAIRKRSGVYLCGSEAQFAWYLQKVRAGKVGGLTSAAKRLAKKGASGAWSALEKSSSEGKQRLGCAYKKASGGNPPTPTPTPTPTHLKKNIKCSKQKIGVSDETADVIFYLNEKCGKSFKPETWDKLVRKALSAGFSLQDLKTVVDVKLKDQHFRENPKYYRPKTLWGSAQKIESYLGENSKLKSSLVDYLKAKGYE